MVNKLIKDYFSLTGRPIATMTVDEYLSFVKAGCLAETPVLQSPQKDTVMPSPRKDNERETPKTAPQKSPSDTKNANNALQMLKSIAG